MGGRPNKNCPRWSTSPKNRRLTPCPTQQEQSFLSIVGMAVYFLVYGGVPILRAQAVAKCFGCDIARGDTAALEALLPDRWPADHPEQRLEQPEEESREAQARRRRKRVTRRASPSHSLAAAADQAQADGQGAEHKSLA